MLHPWRHQLLLESLGSVGIYGATSLYSHVLMNKGSVKMNVVLFGEALTGSSGVWFFLVVLKATVLNFYTQVNVFISGTLSRQVHTMLNEQVSIR